MRKRDRLASGEGIMSKTYRIANPERIERVLFLRRSNAAVAIPSRKQNRKDRSQGAIRVALRKEFS
jgi:hypothetical protein